MMHRSMIYKWKKEISDLYRNAIESIVDINTRFDITYDAGDGKVSPSSYRFTIGESVTMPTPTLSGYKFLGWSTDKNATVGKYEARKSYIFGKGDITLYAVWTSANTITLDPVDGTVSPASLSFTAGESVKLPTPTRLGYTFLGWADSKSATVGKYEAGKSYAFAEGNTTLYAIWQACDFNIVYHANGGTFAGGDTEKTDTKTYNASYTIPKFELVREGYTFSGKWSESANGAGKYEAGKSYGSIGGSGLSDKHLYAVWTKDSTCTVTYDYNNAADPKKVTRTVAPGNYTIEESETKADFKGWMYLYPNGPYTWKVNGESHSYSLLQPGDELNLTGDLYLYAKWEYFVHYTDGTGSMTDKVRDGEDYFIESNFEDGSGDTFLGWRNTYTGEILQPYKTIDLTEDLNLVAILANENATESYVTLTYDANGGTGSTSKTVKAGTKVKLDDGSGLRKANAEFLGWATKSNATKVEYEGDATIRLNEDLTLYAVWRTTNDTTPCTVRMYTFEKAYKPGDLAYLGIVVTDSDHFYLDTSAGGFTFTGQDGLEDCTAGNFFERNAISIPEGYNNNKRYYNNAEYVVNLQIPEDCAYGKYPVTITVSNGAFDGDSGSVDATSKISSTIYVTVNADGKEEIAVDITTSKIVLHEGDLESLDVSVTPASYAKNVKWESSNEKVATVNSRGRVVARGVGNATITATVNGVSDTCTVEVEECSFTEKVTDAEYLKKAATCKSYAEYYYSCECGYAGTKTFEDKKGGYGDHRYGNWITTTEPTETEPGEQTRYCSVCDEADTKTIAALGHAYGKEWYFDETDHWHECDCGAKADVAAHTDTDENGKCDTCDYPMPIEEKPIEHEHSWSSTYSKDEDYHWFTCSGCDETGEKALHTPGGWIVDKAATATTDGSCHTECTVCGYVTDRATIPATGSTGPSFNYAEWLRYLALLESQKFTIQANAGVGGSISADGNGSVPFGKDTTYTITPDKGYAIDSVVVDGKNVGAVSSYTFRDVRKNHTISATFTKVPALPFADVTETDWFFEDVKFAYENELMLGTADTTFSPNEPVNRAMLVTILWRLEGAPTAANGSFTDVADGEWYSDAVNWASACGIVNGFGDGTFGPLSALTHEQVMTILSRYAAYKGLTATATQTQTADHTYSTWATDNVLWAAENGMLTGLGTDISDLTAQANRAELAAYLRRFCTFLAK